MAVKSITCYGPATVIWTSSRKSSTQSGGLGCIRRHLGTRVSPHQMVQAGLPISSGGCGLRCATTFKPAGRLAELATFYTAGASRVGIASYARQVKASWVLPPVQDALSRLGPIYDPLTSWQGNVSAIAQAEPEHLLQKWWKDSLANRALTYLLDHVPPRDQALLLEQQCSVTGSFMSITPNAAFRTLIPSS